MRGKCFGGLFYINKTKELYQINVMLKASFDPNSEGKRYKSYWRNFNLNWLKYDIRELLS